MGETGRVMPQAAAAPAPTVVPEKPKGAIGIWIGVLLIVGGIIFGIVLVVSGARSLVDGFDDLVRVPINGGGIVRIEQTGSQTVYAERPAVGSGSSFSTGTTFSGYGPNVAIRIIGPDGSDVSFNASGPTETYTMDGREGVKVGSFYAATTGEYRVVSRAQDNNGNWQRIAVGDAIELSGIGAILGGIFGGGLVVLIGVVLVIIFAVRRSRSKKRIAQASSPYPGAYGAAGAGWPAAPGYAPAGTGYGAPPAPGAGSWSQPGSTSPGWVPPPVVQPGEQGPGPTWSPPPPPAPQTPSGAPTWQPPAAPPAWQPSGDAPAPTPPSTPPPGAPADPLAPSWEPPAGDATPPPPPPPGGDGGSAS